MNNTSVIAADIDTMYELFRNLSSPNRYESMVFLASGGGYVTSRGGEVSFLFEDADDGIGTLEDEATMVIIKRKLTPVAGSLDEVVKKFLGKYKGKLGVSLAMSKDGSGFVYGIRGSGFVEFEDLEDALTKI